MKKGYLHSTKRNKKKDTRPIQLQGATKTMLNQFSYTILSYRFINIQNYISISSSSARTFVSTG